MFNGKSILITGGTGSFGRRAVKKILQAWKPERMVVYSRDEFKQYTMQEELSPRECHALRYFLGDVRDRERLSMAMRNIDYVIHAAALKQVPAAEYNPMECIKTNVLGASNVIHAAIENKVKKVVALSTDKAANPINLYGATKLCADKLFVAGNNLAGKGPTRFSVVRYGNVMGSRGSVIPLFQKLAAEQAPFLPVTDPEMTRFWITLDQGVDFVLKAFHRMWGGEIFVPKIPSARITDLARAIAPEIPLKIVGIRPGEKLHEIMCPRDDARSVLEFEDHYVISPSILYVETEKERTRNALGEEGKPVAEEFEYSSGTNPWFFSVEEIQKLIKTM
jgi:UDP-N-acetylglucosamine 4,6-dehydratase